jgi:rhamnose transport system ATP-binding protein
MPGLEFRDIRKSFGAVKALTGVSFSVLEREAHAIVGENGAGKSTLLKILAGIVRPDAGQIRWRDAPLEVTSPREAIDRGVGMVYQEMLSFPNLSVSANIFAGRELCTRGVLRESAMRDRTRAILDRLYLRIDPDAAADSLSAAHRQLLQVARALAFECQILVLDEPTTALTDAEADHLFEVLGDIKRHGTTILYVSHRLPEVFRLCDRITVLRDGGFVGTFSRSEVAPSQIVKAMVGRELPMRSSDKPKGLSPQDQSQTGDGSANMGRGDKPSGLSVAAEDQRLEVVRLTREPGFRDVTLSVKRGEIVGLFGLVGSGRSELLETVFGLHRPSAGEVRIDGARVELHSARDAGRAGIALVPEERQRQGLMFNLSVRHNLVLPRRVIHGDVIVRNGAESAEATSLMREWRIKAPGVDALPDTLSGGNQQKVVAAKWLATSPRVLLLDEPTKGVDVGAKFEIHELIRREADAGIAVLLVSSDLPEVLALADRIVVMREGHLQGELSGSDATEEAVMHLATAQLVSPKLGGLSASAGG